MTFGRKTLTAVGALAVALAAVPAFAADMPQPQASDPVFTQAPTQAAYLWAGPYVGFHVGYGWGDSTTVIGGTGAGADVDGFIGGIQGGYNFQSNNFVYGFEADISYSDADGSTFFFGPPLSVEQNWLATLRARAGVTFGPSLLYITGGAAFTDVDVALAGVGGGSNTYTGWTIGGGWEYAFNDRLSMKAEYLYADFGDEAFNLGGTPALVDLDQHIARIGVNWRFGGGY